MAITSSENNDNKGDKNIYHNLLLKYNSSQLIQNDYRVVIPYLAVTWNYYDVSNIRRV